MPAEAGINIRVNDDGSLQLKNFEKQVDSTFSTTKKHSEGIVSKFNRTSKSIIDTLKTTGQLALTVRFAFKAYKLLWNSGYIQKIGVTIGVTAAAIAKKIGIVGGLQVAFNGLRGAIAPVSAALLGLTGKAGKAFAVLKAGGIAVAGLAAGGFGKLRIILLALVSPITALVKMFLTTTAAGAALTAVIRRLATTIKTLWLQFKGSATVQSALGSIRSQYAASGVAATNMGRKAKAGFSQAKESAKGFGKEAAKAPGFFKQMAGGVGDYAKKSKLLNAALRTGKSLFKTWLTLGPLMQGMLLGLVAAAGGAAIALLKFSKAAIRVGSQNEMFTVQYKALYGTVEKANEKFKEVREVTAKTPFQLDEMIMLNAQLKTVTNGFIDGAKGLTLIADAAATVNQPLSEVGRNVARVFAGIKAGIPVGMELMRLTEIGIISGETRGQLTELINKSKDSKKSLEVFENALLKFKGGAKALSLTLAGVTSNIRDMNRELLSQAGDRMIQPIKGMKKVWLEFITSIKEIKVFEGVGIILTAILNLLATAVSVILDPIKILINSFIQLRNHIKTLLSPINGLSKGAGRLWKLFDAFRKNLASLQPLLFIVRTVFWGIGKAIEIAGNFTFKIIGAFTKWIGKFKPIKAFFTWFDGILGKIAKFLGVIADKIDRFGEDIGAGTLFGTYEKGKTIASTEWFLDIQNTTTQLIKSLQEQTEKEKVIAKYEKKRQEMMQDLLKGREKLKGDDDPLSGIILDIQKKARILALFEARKRELDALDKKLEEERLKKLAEKIKLQTEQWDEARDLYDTLTSGIKTEKDEIINRGGELIKRMRELHRANIGAVEGTFGSLSGGLEAVSKFTEKQLDDLKKKTRGEIVKQARENNIERQKNIDSLYSNITGQLAPRDRFAEINRDANNQISGALSDLRDLRKIVGGAGIEGLFDGKSQEEIRQMIIDNIIKERDLLIAREKNVDMEKKFNNAIDGINSVKYGITSFQDLMSGNFESGLGGLGDIFGSNLQKVLKSTLPYGELFGTGFSLLGQVLDLAGSKAQQEHLKLMNDIKTNTAKANTYLASVDRNMSKLTTDMNKLFILNAPAYYGNSYSLPEILDNEIGAG